MPTDVIPQGVSYSETLYRPFWFKWGARFAALLGRTGTRAVGKMMGLGYYLTHPQKRTTVRANLALTRTTPVEERMVRATFINYGAALADYFIIGVRPKEEAQALATERTGFEHLQKVMATGRGALLVTAHLGLFELGGVAMDEFHLPTVILSLPEPTPGLGEWRAQFRKRWSVETLEVGDDQLSSLAIIRKLKEGSFVAMLMDRPFNENRVLVDFPNGQVPFSTGPVWLSLLSGSPIIIVTVVELPTGHYRLVAHPPLETHWLPAGRDETVRHFTTELGLVFRKTICEYPDQWYQFVRLV